MSTSRPLPSLIRSPTPLFCRAAFSRLFSATNDPSNVTVSPSATRIVPPSPPSVIFRSPRSVDPVRSSTPPRSSRLFVVFPSRAALSTDSVPPLRYTIPENVLFPVSRVVPSPECVSDTDPTIPTSTSNPWAVL